MKRDGKTPLLARWLEAGCVLALLGACSTGVETPLVGEGLANVNLEETVDGARAPLLEADLYANAVTPSTTAGVLLPSLAVGAPDGRAASVLALLGAALVLDLGAGEPGTGDLKVHYQGLLVTLVTWVDFLAVDGRVLASGPLKLVGLDAGRHTALVPYSRVAAPYRYVRLNGGLALYQVDAVEASGIGTTTCGNGELDDDETCDDGNPVAEDGCGGDCQIEQGYTCEGLPSRCSDINECLDPSTHGCTDQQTCINSPGSYTCWNGICRPPHQVCASECFSAATNREHCGRCGNRCGWRDLCIRGECKPSGKLAFIAKWSRPGNGDLVVKTPGGILIRAENPGSDGDGEFIVDDTTGKGPEIIYWAPGKEPEIGRYNICVMATAFAPPPDESVVVVEGAYLGPQGGLTQRGIKWLRSHSRRDSSCEPTDSEYVGYMTYWGSFAPESWSQ